MAQDHDVLIIGSGASGGMMARQLTAKGIKCLMLDAGPAVDFDRDRVVKNVYDLPYRGFVQPGRFPHITQANEFNANVWADEKLNPYTYDPSSPYYWVRVRRIGGKTLMWGRASWRLSNFEFHGKDHDGFGDNWPISYEDLAPYYDKVEPLLRVAGRKEGLPQLPDGVFIDEGYHPSEPVRRFAAAAKQKGIPTTQPRRATGQMASSVNLMLPDALATGNLKIISNAVVREITTDPNTGLVNGANFIDRQSRRDYHVKARVIVLGASTLESTRMLLNSKLANSSGVLGHYLFDQFYVKNIIVAVIPEARSAKNKHAFAGSGYVPRFRNLTTKEPKFIRGYAFDFASGQTPSAEYVPLYGDELKKELAELEGAAFHMTAMGEVLPRRENFVRIDHGKVDAWGIPVLHIQQRYTDNEFEMAKDAMNVADELSHDAGFQVLAKHWQMVPPGESIHELGTCRMGNDPKTSVLNRYNQTHDIRNLFVVDGGAFVSGGSQNPTLTICALSMRAGDYIAERMRTREI
ncbi:MAG: GMC family oxidoreductase [Acidobacteriaceae bacterium]|nr:GMC family oxidoreductase [Acidobacteriaceae bacterium]